MCRPGGPPGYGAETAAGPIAPTCPHGQRVLRCRGRADRQPIDRTRLRILTIGFLTFVSGGDDHEQVRLPPDVVIHLAAVHSVGGIGGGSPAVAVYPCAALIGLVEQIPEVKREPAQTAGTVEQRLKDDLRPRGGTFEKAIGRNAVSRGRARNVGSVSMGIVVISRNSGAAACENLEQPSGEIGMRVINSGVGNTDNLIGPVQSSSAGGRRGEEH